MHAAILSLLFITLFVRYIILIIYFNNTPYHLEKTSYLILAINQNRCCKDKHIVHLVLIQLLLDFWSSVTSSFETVTTYLYPPAKPINPGHPFYLKLAPNLEKDKVFTIWRFNHIFPIFWIFILTTRHCNLFFSSTDVIQTFFHTQNEMFKLPHHNRGISNSAFDLRVNNIYCNYLELMNPIEFPDNETTDQKMHRVNEAIRSYDFVTGLFRDLDLNVIINAQTNALVRRQTQLLRSMDISLDRINYLEPIIRDSCHNAALTANDFVFYNLRLNFIHDLVVSANFNNSIDVINAIANL